jgi:hypothetical protein
MKYTKEQRTTLLQQWRISGKSRFVFCTENGINPNTFQYWKEREKKECQTVNLVEITHSAKTCISDNVAILIEAGSLRITLPASIGPSGIETILKTIWNIAC